MSAPTTVLGSCETVIKECQLSCTANTSSPRARGFKAISFGLGGTGRCARTSIADVQVKMRMNFPGYEIGRTMKQWEWEIDIRI